jgi:uncharacterized membrane protein
MPSSFRQLMCGQNFGTTRLEAFSDGVFAIVITLLVLELRVPDVHDAAALAGGLRDLAPKFICFVVSFIYITIYWINHHQLFHAIKKTSRGLFWLNSLFLMFLTFIPFPTALIGSFPTHKVAVIFYGLAMMATAVSFVFMKIYVFSEGLTEDKKKPQLIYLVAGPLLYVLALLSALLNTWLAVAIYVAIPVIYFFAAGLEEKTQ